MLDIGTPNYALILLPTPIIDYFMNVLSGFDITQHATVVRRGVFVVVLQQFFYWC